MMNSNNLKRAVILGAAAAMLSGCGNFAQRVSEPIRRAVQLEPNARSGENYQKMIQLMGRLMMGEEQERADAAGKLGILNDARAVPSLIAALQKDPSKLVRSNAAWALGEIGDPSAASALREALGDPDELTRNDAAAALRKLKPGAPSTVLHK